MNILVDVNVFEDVFRQRIGWEASLAVIGSVANTQVTGYVSALTAPILYFFRRRTRGEKAARLAVQGILRGFAIVSLGDKALEAAYVSPLPDFEDALQTALAPLGLEIDKIDTIHRTNLIPLVRILGSLKVSSTIPRTRHKVKNDGRRFF